MRDPGVCPPPELRTDRLLLRAFAEDDWRAVHEYACDPEVVRYMPWGPNTEEQTREFNRLRLQAQEAPDGSEHCFAVVLRAEGRLIGGCNITLSDNPDNREAWIGYCLNRRYWGQGYGTEVARALIAFGFGSLGLHRIFATCDPRNIGSWRVMEKVGMQREGRLRGHKWQRGQWRDSFLYGTLEDEWQTREQAGRPATSS